MANSSAFQWINEDAIREWEVSLDHFKQMADKQVVFDAGKEAGKLVKTTMQDLIYSQPKLKPYQDVAERITVWGEPDDNVYVGVPEGDPVLQRAHDMDMIFPVDYAAEQIHRQSGQAQQAFETALIEKVF